VQQIASFRDTCPEFPRLLGVLEVFTFSYLKHCCIWIHNRCAICQNQESRIRGACLSRLEPCTSSGLLGSTHRSTAETPRPQPPPPVNCTPTAPAISLATTARPNACPLLRSTEKPSRSLRYKQLQVQRRLLGPRTHCWRKTSTQLHFPAPTSLYSSSLEKFLNSPRASQSQRNCTPIAIAYLPFEPLAQHGNEDSAAKWQHHRQWCA
jgi:hypothetical protein